MADARRLLTNWSKGELSPLIEGRSDIEAYFEGGSTIENWTILRQGGLERRLGFRYVAEVKDSTKDTILIPFEPDIDNATMLEVGNGYSRFFKNKAPILSGPTAHEIATPYTTAQLRSIHYTQSVDVLFTFHSDVAQHKISRIADTNWTVLQTSFRPPATFEANTDVSGGTITLTPATTTGESVIFTASAAVFLAADVGRTIISGTAKAIIVAFGASAADTATPNDHVRADIIDAFPDTSAIAAGSWFLGLSPQTTLDPNKKEPVGSQVTFTAGANAFRAADVGKYIKIYGGVAKIDTFTSATSIKGELLSVMGGTTDANPAAAPAGSWSMEVNAWSSTYGFPRTGEFVQGRLTQAATKRAPTDWWMSASDNFDSYADGVTASDALVYTLATRGFNRIEWIVDNDDMFIGTSATEHRFTSGKSDEPFGGDITPLNKRIDTQGSASVQPVSVAKRILFVDRSGKKIFQIAFDIEQDGPATLEITDIAEHILGTGGLRTGPVAYARRPDSRIYYVRTDGELVALTFYPNQKVIGFSRYKTDGTFEAVGVIPQSGGKPDQLWAIIKRTINGVTKQYVEVQDEDASELAGRAWTSLQTDCAKVYDLNGVATTVLTGLSHLEGKTVDIIADGSARAQQVVTGGQITLAESASETVEVGLSYNSTATTMRPAIEGQMLEGIPRQWTSLFLRLYKAKGGTVNSETLEYPADALDTNTLYTGDLQVRPDSEPSTDGRVTILQNEPYPMTVLALFGDIQFGDHS